ncbi:MAG: ABC transporter permease [Bdellovibrionaceae bacterium]|nr:ABC transporter permease [Pseudobdellovibrionaceae bacterium]NUM59052.1 ABC transporter permease [Pseudobdellovibrionaceae bacterium]
MLFLAFRHIFARPKQSLLTLLGVALGTTAFITFAAIMTGFQSFIIDQLVNNDAYVKISAKEKMVTEKDLNESLFKDKIHTFWTTSPSGRQESAKINYPLGWYKKLDNDSRVVAYTPLIGAMVLYIKGGISISGKLQGVDPISQVKVTNIMNYIIAGDYQSLSGGGNKIIIGQGLLGKMGAKLNDSILISVGKADPIPFKVSGVFKTGIMTLDDTFGYAYIRDVQRALSRPSEITDIAIRLTDVSESLGFADEYGEFTDEKVQSWEQSNANILSVFSLQNFIRTFITIAIMIVASFGIYNILNILVNQKRKDIGILRSFGYDAGEIQNLFMIQGLFLGITGGIIGLFFGFVMSLYLSTLRIGGMTDKLMINFSLELYSMGILMAVAASVISSYLPARAAGKLNPIDIVRSGE